MRRVVIFFALCVTLCVTLSSFVVAQNWSGESKRKPPAPPVVVDTVKSGQIQARLWYSGNLRSRDFAELATEDEGRVAEIVEVGSRVEKGEVIARLDDTLLAQDLNVELADVASNEARLEFLKRETERLKELVKNNNAAVSRYEERLSEMKMAQAARKASQARAQRTKELLRRITIVAPYKGIVQQRYVEVGEWVDKGNSLVRFVGSGRLEVSVGVTAQALSFISPGDTLTVRINKEYHLGTVHAVVPAAAADTRLFDLRLDVPSTVGLAGQMVNVAVPVDTPRHALLVSEDALVIRGDGIKVFVISDDLIARSVPVRTGLSQGAQVEVFGDLQVGDKVAVRGSERLRDGAQVRLINIDKDQGMPGKASLSVEGEATQQQ